MLAPPSLVNESTRLKSLLSLRILDTAAEERFDRITRMAQRLFDVKICLISLVDSERQWFKSRQGLDVSETAREVSFCAHAIAQSDVLVIDDALADPRFADNPLVTQQPFIRFYAGCPIASPDGYPIGTLCLIDATPRRMTDEDLQLLRDTATLVEEQIALSTQATTDDLTQIANRRGFNLIARHVLSLCQRHNSPAELAYFDIDGLKAINDRAGHAAGDALLKLFARHLTECFRDADVVARVGGDEFAVLMVTPGTEANPALARLMEAVAADRSPLAPQLSWSVGSVHFDAERHTTIESMLADADARMYQHKSQRRLTGS